MTAPINQQPTGLLGLLGIKNGGRNPDELSPTLAPVMDVTQLYLEQNARYAQVLTNAAGSLNIFAQVPQGEVWYIHHASVASGPLAAGDQCEIFLAVSTASNLDWVGVGDKSSAVATESVAAVLQRPFVLGSGNQLCYYGLTVVTGLGIPVLCSVRYTPMQA